VERQLLDIEDRTGKLKSRSPSMSNINEWMEEHQGQVNALGHLAAINQRNPHLNMASPNPQAN